LQNLLLTPAQIAARLGIEGRSDIVADFLRRGLLPIAGQDEEGVPLVRQHYVEQRGLALLARDFGALRSPRLHRLVAADLPPPLPCGCAIDQQGQPTILCRTGRALEVSALLAQAFLAAAPVDSFFVRLAAVTAKALLAHLSGGRGERRVLHDNHTGQWDAERPASRNAAIVSDTPAKMTAR
jgi:hypothetical protein